MYLPRRGVIRQPASEDAPGLQWQTEVTEGTVD